MKDEGKRGLKPYIHKDGDVLPSPDPKAEYPNFEGMLMYTHAAFVAKMSGVRKDPVMITCNAY